MRAGLAIALLLIGCTPKARDSARRDGGMTPVDANQFVPDAETTAKDAGSDPDAAAPDSGPMTPDAGDLCIDGPHKIPRSNVFFGTDLPQYVPLTTGQIMAVGEFFECSGSLITPTWVLTAKHCGLNASATFCMGVAPDNANVCVDATRVIDHQSADLTLVELDTPATMLLAVEPIPILVDNLNQSWVGMMAEAAGYGQDENGNFGHREFTAEPIVGISGDFISIDGQGVHGVCFGDSGGPVMVIGSDGTPRVAGALSEGDESCVGVDDFTRVDLYRAWIESYTGPTMPIDPPPCGSATVEGSCSDDRRVATWCGPNDELASQACAAGEVCGWSDRDLGYRCIDVGSDPCQGVSFDGDCSFNTLSWCQNGELLQRDCDSCGETCLPIMQGGWNCVMSSCGDIDYFGKCEGQVAVWCNETGALERLDCGAQSQTCGWVDEDIGYYCQ